MQSTHRRRLIFWVLPVAAVAMIGTLVAGDDDGPARLVMTVAGAAIFGTMALDGWRRGAVDVKAGELKRWANPVGYWLFVVFYSVCALVVLLAGILRFVLR